MVDPVNLNIPGFRYLFFAVVFLIVVLIGAGLLSPLELAIQRHHRSRAESGDSTEDAGITGTDLLFGAARVVSSSESTTIRECRECGTTLEPDEKWCPGCGAPPDSIARYDLG